MEKGEEQKQEPEPVIVIRIAAVDVSSFPPVQGFGCRTCGAPVPTAGQQCEPCFLIENPWAQ